MGPEKEHKRGYERAYERGGVLHDNRIVILRSHPQDLLSLPHKPIFNQCVDEFFHQSMADVHIIHACSNRRGVRGCVRGGVRGC